MEDFYSAFIELSLQQCTIGDYSNRLKVRTHNIVTKKLIALKKKMLQYDCRAVILKLLDNQEDRVKLNAALFCVENNILYEKGKITLTNLLSNSNDASIRFSAKMILNQLSK